MNKVVRVRWLLAVVSVVHVLAVLQLRGLAQPEWQARTSARLVVDRQASYAYDQDALGRESVLLTFAAMASDQAFVRQALEQRELAADHAEAFDFRVTSAPRAALVTFTVRGPDEGDVLGLALGVRTAAISRINALAPLYQLRPEATASLAPVSGHGPNQQEQLLVLAMLALLLVAAAWLRPPRVGAPTGQSGA